MSSINTTGDNASDMPQNVAATFCATLIDEWVRHGVGHAMIAPGSRSTPLALALAARSDVHVHVFHDERAASFAALGIGLLGVPAILVCTSGTAAAHFHAAVVEAHQAGVPMLVCTADRPPELRDVGAPQTIDQTKLYGTAVRWFHDPGVADRAASNTWRSLAAHSFAAATAERPGPVHLNLPFREPLVGAAGELPPRLGSGQVALSSRARATDEALNTCAALLGRERGLIIAGRGAGDPDAVAALAEATGWPVLADARSGLRHRADIAVARADRMLRDAAFADEHIPEVVVRLGEPPASRVLAHWLAGSWATQVHVSAAPGWPDPDGAIGTRVIADPSDTCRRLARLLHRRFEETTGLADSWLQEWLDADQAADAAIALCLTDIAAETGGGLNEPAAARAVGTALPVGAHLVVSSSMPIRDVEWFGTIPAGLTVHSNRGANGIDGVIATAIGVALASSAPTGLLIGDVAFVHDSSALVALAGRVVGDAPIDLRIVVVDNDGGGIFSFLPQAESLSGARFEQLFGTPHHTDLLALAAAHGLPGVTVETSAELTAALALSGPRVIRVASDRAANVIVHDRLNAC